MQTTRVPCPAPWPLHPNDEKPMSNETTVLTQVQDLLDERIPAEETISAIRRLLELPSEQPIECTNRGWPILRASETSMDT
jgi:hypothetical protein